MLNDCAQDWRRQTEGRPPPPVPSAVQLRARALLSPAHAEKSAVGFSQQGPGPQGRACVPTQTTAKNRGLKAQRADSAAQAPGGPAGSTKDRSEASSAVPPHLLRRRGWGSRRPNPTTTAARPAPRQPSRGVSTRPVPRMPSHLQAPLPSPHQLPSPSHPTTATPRTQEPLCAQPGPYPHPQRLPGWAEHPFPRLRPPAPPLPTWQFPSCW